MDFDGSTEESDERSALFDQSLSILLYALQHRGAGLSKKIRRRCQKEWPNVEDSVEDRGVSLTMDDEDTSWKNSAQMLNTIAITSLVTVMSEEAAIEDSVDALDEVLESIRLLCQKARSDKEVYETIVDLSLSRPFVEAARNPLQTTESIS